MPDPISIREFARRMGVNHSAIVKRLKAGTLSRLPDGKLDAETAEREWFANRDESQVREKGKALVLTLPSPGSQGDPAAYSFNDAKTRREYVRLEREALNLEQQKGELAPIGEINAFVAGMIINARDRLLKIGAQLKDRLAETTEAHHCQRLVDDEVILALRDMAQYRPASFVSRVPRTSRGHGAAPGVGG